MTGVGIQAWVLALLGIRSAFAHQEIAAAIEMLHVLGNSYRLASSGVVSGAVYGRFTFGFCRAVAVAVVDHLASRRFRDAQEVWQTGAA